MWSRIVSLVDDLNNDDDDDSETGNEGNTRDKVTSTVEDDVSLRNELTKYKERVIHLREELHDAESQSQELSHEYSHMIQEKDDEVTQLRIQLETSRNENNELKKRSNSGTEYVSQRINDATITMQKEISSLKSDYAKREIDFQSSLNERIKENNILKEKLVRVESNLHLSSVETPVSPVKLQSPDPSVPDTLIWLQSLRHHMESMVSGGDNTVDISPPPSLSSGEMYICLDGVYSAINIINARIQTSDSVISELKSDMTKLKMSVMPVLELLGVLSESDVTCDRLCSLLSDASVALSSMVTSKQLLQAAEVKQTELEGSLYEAKQQLSDQTQMLARERERCAVSVGNAERRYESLKGDVREYLQREQEQEEKMAEKEKELRRYEEMVKAMDVRMADGKKLEETASKMKDELVKRRQEIDSLGIQLAAYKGENDQLLEERMEYQNDMKKIDEMKRCISEKDHSIVALNETIETLSASQTALQEEGDLTAVQLKNAQEDLNFAQLCVRNLQASLAVYTASQPVEEQPLPVSLPQSSPIVVAVEDRKDDRSVCLLCVEKEKAAKQLERTVGVMDEELQKLRKAARDEQNKMKSRNDELQLHQRMLRQLFVTYLTSPRGGLALKALMGQLVYNCVIYEVKNLSDDEQRVVILNEVQKYQDRDENEGGFMSWIGGIALGGVNMHEEVVDTSASVEELWNRLFQNEKTK